MTLNLLSFFNMIIAEINPLFTVFGYILMAMGALCVSLSFRYLISAFQKEIRVHRAYLEHLKSLPDEQTLKSVTSDSETS